MKTKSHTIIVHYLIPHMFLTVLTKKCFQYSRSIKCILTKKNVPFPRRDSDRFGIKFTYMGLGGLPWGSKNVLSVRRCSRMLITLSTTWKCSTTKTRDSKHSKFAWVIIVIFLNVQSKAKKIWDIKFLWTETTTMKKNHQWLNIKLKTNLWQKRGPHFSQHQKGYTLWVKFL